MAALVRATVANVHRQDVVRVERPQSDDGGVVKIDPLALFVLLRELQSLLAPLAIVLGPMA